MLSSDTVASIASLSSQADLAWVKLTQLPLPLDEML